jgi:hypothetical protein
MAAVKGYFRDEYCIIPFIGVSHCAWHFEKDRFLVRFHGMLGKGVAFSQETGEQFMDEYAAGLDAREAE